MSNDEEIDILKTQLKVAETYIDFLLSQIRKLSMHKVAYDGWADCGSCRWWKQYDYTTTSSNRQGACTRRAPVINPHGDETPTTENTYMCGDYVPKYPDEDSP